MDGFLRPDWPVPATVAALCTTRAAPVGAPSSPPPFAAYNLALHVGDAVQAVQRNRQHLAAHSAAAVYLQQVHGCVCVTLHADDRVTAQTFNDHAQADAACTTVPQLACCIMVADCLPVLFASSDGQVVAAAHAGWRGLAAGVLEHTLDCMRLAWQRETGHNARSATPVPVAPATVPILAWLGPCIGATAFEVGHEVVDALSAAGAHPVITTGLSARARPLLDLAASARARLEALGIACYGNDSSPTWCTYSQAERFYSYRYAQERGRSTGRQAALVWRCAP